MRRVRFGIMCGGDLVSAWAVRVVQRILESCDSQLCIVISDPELPQRSSRQEKLRKALLLRGNLWHLHNRLFPLRQLPQHAPVPVRERWPAVPVRICETTRKGKWTQLFSPEDIAEIRAHDLDFIVKFGYGIIRGDILTSARHGIWSFHHDDEQQFRGGPPAFWEIATGTAVQAAILQRLTERLDGGIVLDKIWVNTEPLSYRRNLGRILDASVDMPARAALRLSAGRTDLLSAAPVKTDAPIYVAPTDAEMSRFSARVARNYVAYKQRNQFVEHWNVGLVRAPIHRFLDPSFIPDVEWAPYSRRDHMIADPFGVPAGDGVRVYCEEYSFHAERGWISSMQWSPRDGWSQPQTVLDDGHHMSYPFVVGSGTDLRIVPECASREGVTQYRVTESGLVPDGTVLGAERLLDSTIFEHDGRWWLFATRGLDEPNAKLCIWHGPSSTGPWIEHQANPVKTDVRNGRPAGTPFVHAGRLYRPAQDCSSTYGFQLVINEVTLLTDTDFEETPVRTLSADARSPYPHGLHTLSGCGEVTLIDGKREGIDARMLGYRVRQKLQRRLR